MKLKQLRITPESAKGWSSKPMRFAEDITQLFGPNACGKTPILHSIAYALGYPVKYRDDIQANCGYAELIVEHNSVEYTFSRKFGQKFVLVVSTQGQADEIFYNEADFSTYIFRVLGVTINSLTHTNNTAVIPYFATFLPLFYIDQDTGYTNFYKAQGSFIKDQYAEMVRLALGMAPRHPFERRRLLHEKQNDLKNAHAAILDQDQFLTRVLTSRKWPSKSPQEIEQELEATIQELEQLRMSHDATILVDSSTQFAINEKLREKATLDNQIKDLQIRINGFTKIQNDIEVEINTLVLNEEAKRVFTSFEEICTNNQCQLFFSSSESYAKSLLYLRDQIKDLDRNNEHHKIRLEEMMALSGRLARDASALRERISNNNNQSTSGLVNLISNLTRSLIDLQREKDIVERIERESTNYVGLLNFREQLENDIASMGGTRESSDLGVIEFRAKFKEKIIEWLNVLQTRNVSREVTVDPDFNILFGNEKLQQFSGSTLLRIVLATKAAFFDVYINKYLPKIQFLIFDTPAQHDIEFDHLDAFILQLKELVKGTDCQVIFSTTQYHYVPIENDIEWNPPYPGVEQNMFLGIADETPENVAANPQRENNES